MCTYYLPTLNSSQNSSASLLSLYKKNSNKYKMSKQLKNKFLDTSLNRSKQTVSQTIDTHASTKISTNNSIKTLINLNHTQEVRGRLTKLNTIYNLCEREEKAIKDLNCSLVDDIKNKKTMPYNKAMNKYYIKEQIKLHNSNEEAERILLNTIMVAQSITKKKLNVRKLQPMNIKNDLFRTTKLNESSLLKFKDMIKARIGEDLMEDEDDFRYCKTNEDVPVIDFSDPASIQNQAKKIKLIAERLLVKKKRKLPKMKKVVNKSVN
jgi:hypothetical protein